ncbi:allantoate amidohydrolase [Nocardioides sp.]|uniref:allantoate amidohydrolase n=1 Tax=Nocardioides sp. TaxID=35761 RepID=UPI0035154C63
MSRPDDLERMWRDLAPIGRSARSGGYDRSPWHGAELELRAWFRQQAGDRGLAVEEDPFGNLVAWWRPAGTDGARAVLTGSHLDSVPDGGAFDGPLGVVSALAALDLLREQGVAPARPLGIAVFAEEEGSRFGRACLGSRLASGTTGWDDARELVDAGGTRLGDLVPGGAPDGWLLEADTYVELHVEQGRALVDRGAAVGVGSAIWPHGRWRYDVLGRADHAGTTRMEDRVDPMLTVAMTVLAANKQARISGQRATFGRVEVHPNGTNAVPSRVSAWLDARAESDAALQELVAGIERQARERAERDGTTLRVAAESLTGELAFDAALTARCSAVLGGAPVLPTQAGHDAGVLQAAGITSTMLFVRNPTGVSHSPAEHAEAEDCLAGVEALGAVLADLLGEGANGAVA